MPTYGYRCANGHEFEVFQGMTDEPLKKCQQCKAAVRRIFYPVGIVFKGPGFYKTDSRGSAPSADSSATVPAAASSDKATAGEAKSEAKPDTKPDAKVESKADTKGAAKPEPKPAKVTRSEKRSA
ncbi:MAG: FmdB family zinc ribbon protein [Candidatus Dormibacteria bacterium]